ncbi:MAG: carbohydrate ABC transporter permease [Eubacteriales bacterium]|nr:carbohydrate ABC transporter permease [Eubacteriales bacterium]
MTKAKRRTILYILLAFVLAAIFLFPIVWVVISSFKSANEMFSWPPTIFPKELTWDNYRSSFEKGDFLLYFKNSTVVTVCSTLLAVIINTMAGYAFAKYHFKGSNLLFMVILSTIMLPLEVLMIPIFQMIKALGMYNSLFALIIPTCATPTGVFLVRQYFLSVPDELMEASRIDGASETGIFLRIMIPLAKPILSVLAIFNFMWRWNDYLWPLIGIRSPKLYTVQLALKNFAGEYSVDWNSLLAMSVVSMIPMLILFLIFQKQFVQGMATSGLKE